MKEKTIGKYTHSKKIVQSFNLNKEALEHDKHYQNTRQKTFENVILDATERAIDILKAANLPTIYLVRFPCPIRFNGGEGLSILSAYVIKKLGYEHDSIEGLAASILTTIYQIKENSENKERVSLLIFELGELTTLLRINNYTSTTKTTNAKRERKPQGLIDLAEYLVKEYPDFTFNEYWDLIQESDYQIMDCYITDKEKICWMKKKQNDEKEEVLRTKKTFESEYITPARKKYKK